MNVDLIYTKNTEHLASNIARECLLQMYSDNVRVFSNSEMVVSVPHNFRNVIVLASTLNNNDWMELFLLLDALKDAEKIVLCMPYLGYSRQNHSEINESNGASLFLHFLENFKNISRCVFLDTHGKPSVNIPFEHISMMESFAEDIKLKNNNYAVVSPDLGGVNRANDVARILNAPLVICNKTKDILGKIKKVDIIGNVQNKNCVLVDDLVDSGETLCKVSEKLASFGVKHITAYVTHCVNSECFKNLEKAYIDEIVLGNSLNINYQSEKFRIMPVDSLIIRVIRGILSRIFYE